MADPLVTIEWKNNQQPALNATNLNAMQNNIDTYVTENMQEMQRKVDGVVSGMPIGCGCDYFGSTPPEDFMFADGSAISRTTYAELFAIIGTTYGQGDGSTTFNLPDKRTRVSVMRKDNDDTFANLGASGGEKAHTLTINEMPSHTHIQNAHSHTINYKNGYGDGSTRALGYGTISSITDYGTLSTNGQTATNQNTGGGQSHNILQPYLVCNYIIKVQ